MGLIAAFTEGAFPLPELEFSQNVLDPHGSEGMDIEQALLARSGIQRALKNG
jgi:hypothetical protein